MFLGLFDPATCFIFILTFCVMFIYTRNRRKLPPGPSRWPIVGNMFDILANATNLPNAFGRYARRFGNVCYFKFGKLDVVVLNDFQSIHEALVSKSDVFSDRPDFLWIFKEIGPGFILSNGKSWKDLRRLSLHYMRDLGMGKRTVEEYVLEEFKVIEEFLTEHENTPVDVSQTFSAAASNIICRILFGYRFDIEDERFKKMLHALEIIARRSSYFVPVNGLPFLQYIPHSDSSARENVRAFEDLGAVISDIFTEQSTSYDSEHVRNFVDVYIKTKSESESVNFSDHQFLELLVDLFIAGTETTSDTLKWAVLYMMAYPEIQAKCQREMDQVVGTNRVIVEADKKLLPYVEATIMEIMRMSSIVPLSIPHTTLQDASLCGYHIPAKTLILPNLMAVHRDPHFWPEPEIFRPERFLHENVLKRKEGFVPFSLGPRKCPGELLAKSEVFLYFSNLLQRFTLKTSEGHPLSFEGHVSVQRSPSAFKVIAARR